MNSVKCLEFPPQPSVPILNQMDKEKLLTKTHGGALYHDNSADNKELTGKAYFFHERALENKKEKRQLLTNVNWLSPILLPSHSKR